MRRNLLVIATVFCMSVPTNMVTAADYGNKTCPLDGCKLGGCKYSQPLTAEQKNDFTQLVAGNVGRMMILAATVNISKEQKAKMKATFKAHEDDIKKAAKGICDAGKAIDAAVSNDESDAVVQAATDRLEKAFSATILEVLESVHDARTALTKTQKTMIERTVKEMIKSTDSFTDKTGLCPFITAIKMKKSMESRFKKYAQSHKKKHDSKKSHRSKHHSQIHEEFKKMAVGNLGRLMVLYSDMDISVEQKNSIKTASIKRLKTIKEPLINIHGSVHPMVVTITSNQSEKQLKQTADKMAGSFTDLANVFIQLRRDIRSQLNLDQKNKVQKTRKEIEKSVRVFKAKVKKMKAQQKELSV